MIRPVTACLLLAVASLFVGCGSDAAPTARSSAPSRSATERIAGTRAHLTDVGRIDGTPTGLVQRPGDGANYIVTRAGLVLRLVPGRSARTVLDVRKRVRSAGEGGAFDAAFTTDGRQLLLSYGDAKSDDLVVIRRAIDQRGRPHGPEQELVRIGDGHDIHFAGRLVVTAAGDVLLGVGDGGELNEVAGRARRPGSLRGRILRFRGLGRSGATASAPTTVALGLRNPWRFFPDPVTGSIWIGDVGQDRWEEIDRIDSSDAAGIDFGWDLTAGFDRARGLPPAGMRYPVAVYPHDARHCAVIGGPVVRDRTLPGLVGSLVVGDFCSDQIRLVRFDGADPVEEARLPLTKGSTAASFATGLRNEVYVLQSDGRIRRIDPGGPTLDEGTRAVVRRARPTLTGRRAMCGVTAMMAGYPAMANKPPAEVRVLSKDLALALAAYERARLPPAAREPFSVVAKGLHLLLDLLPASGWQPDKIMRDPSVAAELRAGTEAYGQLSRVEAVQCR